MSSDSTVYRMGGVAWAGAFVGAAARVGLEGWGAALGVVLVCASLLCFVAGHRAREHEKQLRRTAEAHPAGWARKR